MKFTKLLLGTAIALSLVLAGGSVSAGDAPRDLSKPILEPAGDSSLGAVIPLPIPTMNLTFSKHLYRFSVSLPGLSTPGLRRSGFFRILNPRRLADLFVRTRADREPRFANPGITSPGRSGGRNAREPE